MFRPIYNCLLKFILTYKSVVYQHLGILFKNLPFILCCYTFVSYGISILVFFTTWDLWDLYMLWLCPPGIFEQVHHVDLNLIFDSKDKVDTLDTLKSFEEVPESNKVRWFRWGVGLVTTGITLYSLYGFLF